MKTEEKIQMILDTVTDIRLHQVRHDERINENSKDIKNNSKSIKMLESDNLKFKGAGLLISIMATLIGMWKGLFK